MQTTTDDPISPVAVKCLEDALGALARTFRAFQLYLPNNPSRTSNLERARAAFSALWTVVPSVSVSITETAFHADNIVVYQDEERGAAGLPWLLYRDGLRRLTLTDGFETDELDSFLDILLRSKTAPAEDDDLVTLLWIADFQCLQYRHVELALDFDSMNGVATDGDGGDFDRSLPAAAQLVETDMPGDGPAPAFLDMESFESTLHFLNPEEVSHLQEELRREYATDGRIQVVAALFDIVEGQDEAAAQCEACEVLDRLIAEALSEGSFPIAATILREARVTLSRASDRIDDAARVALESLSARLSSADVIAQILHAVDAGDHALLAPLLDDLFAELRPSAMVPLLGWYGTSQSSPVRAPIEGAIARLGARHTAELARMFDHHDSSVVHGAVFIARAIPSPPFVAPLTRLLSTGDSSLRADTLAALNAIASPGALQAIERAIEDADRDVRILALRAVSTHGYAGAFPRLKNLLQKRSLKHADLSEKMAFFEAFGSVSGDAGVTILDSMLNGRGLLGHREASDIRACAAHALGVIGSPLAVAALRKGADAQDIVVRSAVSRALRSGS